MRITKAIQSEVIKLKYPPILWLMGFVIAVTLAVVFVAHYLGIHTAIRLGVNPWFRLSATGQAIFFMFVGTPFLILLISAILYIEHQNWGFKQLYTLPSKRGQLVSYKIVAIFLCLLLVLFILIIGLIVVGYSLNMIYPETGFVYYKLPLLEMLSACGGYIVSVLGIIGIQFFLSTRFKGFLVPASIGLLAYIVGFILATVNGSIKLPLYYPYCYPIIANENKDFGLSTFEIRGFGVLNEIQLYSIIIFFAFVLLSFYSERRRGV